ncbi:MAG: hypothetical protein K2Y09_03030 [Nitrosomonas sp.]|uniref:hypothetical protein n=1 Tax=Nitrosomonas sp. TaxID=42353 RepID=UPI001D259D04|nr:hypothetical protein [Nitrosomonas sp.]MBX9894138.1 hypothetical protein [Nitrosomonas sp.]
MNTSLQKITTTLFLIIIGLLTACVATPTREALLAQNVIYSHISGEHYLTIAECLKSKDSFPLPEWHRQTVRDLNTYFIYHESMQVNGYPHFHDEAAKTYYITEIHSTGSSRDTGQPITHGNGNWILIIKDTSTGQAIRSSIEIRSNANLLHDYPPDSYAPTPDASLPQRLHKAETIDRCFD